MLIIASLEEDVAKTVRVKAAVVGLLPMSHREFKTQWLCQIIMCILQFCSSITPQRSGKEGKKPSMTAIHMYLLLFSH